LFEINLKMLFKKRGKDKRILSDGKKNIAEKFAIYANYSQFCRKYVIKTQSK